MSELKIDKTLAKDINALRKKSSYKPFPRGYFNNVPQLEGYIYRFAITKAKIFLIVNVNGGADYKEYYSNKGYHFLIMTSASIETFIKNLYNDISDLIERVNNILDKEQELEDDRAGGIPHGYKLDDQGAIVIDPQEAPLVRKIFKYYSQYRSVHKVADVLKTNFSHVRDVLHDYRYEKMKLPIVSASVLKKTRQLMDVNRKNRTT